MRSKWLCLVVAMAIAFPMLASCATPTPEPEETPEAVAATATPVPTEAPPAGPQPGGTLNMSLGVEMVSFDPFLDIDNWEYRTLVYEAPLRLGREGEFEPGLAESWEVSEDGLSITLHLREGVIFHNGREMTADDVVWSVERASDQDLGHHLGDRFTTCTGATKIDDYTVEVTYSQITHPALDGIARLYIFAQEAVDDIAITPVGTGPFKLEEWVPGDHLTLVRFEEYWQEGLPYLDRLVIKPIPDDQARMVNLLAGSIDFLMRVPLADIELLEQTEDITIVRQEPGFAFDAFIFNVTRPPFDNTLVRQAMNYAVDREKMRELAYHGQGLMTTLPWAPTSWAYPEDLVDYYTFDLDKAKDLLAEAGYPDGFKTEMTIRGTSGVALDVAQIYQEDLAKIGVEMEIVPTELPQYWPLLFDSDFAVVSHATGEATLDPSGMFVGAACCRPFRNFFQITENDTWFPEYKEIIDQSSLEVDQEKRKELYHDAMTILLEQGWTIPLGWRQQIFAVRDSVKGFHTDMDGNIWLTEAWLAE